jgi:hypothetical protein
MTQAELNLRPETILNRKAARACELLKSYSVDVGGLEDVGAHCVYFTRSTGLDLWNELWDAGFRDVDEADEDGNTILMMCSFFDSRSGDLNVHLERAEWLVSRGADLYRFWLGSPAIHRLAEAMAVSMAESEPTDLSALSKQYIQFLHFVVLNDIRDRCDCACCAGGCFALKRLLESIFN